MEAITLAERTFLNKENMYIMHTSSMPTATINTWESPCIAVSLPRAEHPALHVAAPTVAIVVPAVGPGLIQVVCLEDNSGYFLGALAPHQPLFPPEILGP